jgi:hypothetical protein
VSLTQVSARFFLELSVGLCAALACTNRRALGAGFTRLMAGFVLAALLPAWLIARAGEARTPLVTAIAGISFAALVAAALLAAGGLEVAIERALTAVAAVTGLVAVLASLHAGMADGARAYAPLLLASGAGSTLVLGLVTGAMILGHWYLVTPDLPVAHLGKLTALGLVAIYAKLLLLAATMALHSDRFAGAADAIGSVVGIGDGGGAFQSRLDSLWLVARILIGLAGPAVLCHMTLATVRLQATQPATGILYAATVMVLMGELFAFVGEPSFAVVL